MDDNMREMLEKFLANGVDVSSFKFKDENDKIHFFTMYDDYMQIFAQQSEDIEVTIETTATHDVNVFISDVEICYIYFTDDLKSIRMNTFETLDNPALVYCIKVLLGTIKELSQIVNTFANMLSQLRTETDLQDLEEKMAKTLDESKRKKQLYRSVPKQVFDSINKIQEIQKSILDDADKYKISKIKKKGEDK
ncbi:MAG: hypothetical protein GOVbin703_34 [Prokaryotic dsDNA virus sp.]|nr:MAG: hypothetical protein GOVbin703_34 [Prokaryotic dsDNA virus sp.]|tara:strand:- start:781 stop:1359 length:579 start_codon:yes stop_codon:yes gene_type:complete